jgi:hypothetical protein
MVKAINHTTFFVRWDNPSDLRKCSANNFLSTDIWKVVYIKSHISISGYLIYFKEQFLAEKLVD